MPSSSGITIYRNRFGQCRTLNTRLESFWSHCVVVSVQFCGHFGPSWVSAAPSSGHLDIPLLFLERSTENSSFFLFIFLSRSIIFLGLKLYCSESPSTSHSSGIPGSVPRETACQTCLPITLITKTSPCYNHLGRLLCQFTCGSLTESTTFQ